jgi:hypothetical protein
MGDLEGRVESQESLLVSIGAPRLRRLGLTIREPFDSPEHRLYELLRSAHGDAAHSRYNALIRRLSATSAASPSVRELADADRVRPFMRALGQAARVDGACYLMGGTTAVLIGWRATTLHVHIELEPDQDEVLRALPSIKDKLALNVDLASPANFIPLPSGWRERSLFVGRDGHLSFKHFDLYSQALAKLERSHAQDVEDVRAMLDRGLVEAEQLRACFEEIEPELYRFPAVDPVGFRASVEDVVRGVGVRSSTDA